MMEWVLKVIGWAVGTWLGTKAGIWLADGGLRRLLNGNSRNNFLK